MHTSVVKDGTSDLPVTIQIFHIKATYNDDGNWECEDKQMLSLLERVKAITHVSVSDGDPMLYVAMKCAEFFGGEVVDVDTPESRMSEEETKDRIY